MYLHATPIFILTLGWKCHVYRSRLEPVDTAGGLWANRSKEYWVEREVALAGIPIIRFKNQIFFLK